MFILLNQEFSTLQVIFCTKKQDFIVRKCSDKSTYLRAKKARLGCGVCSRIRYLRSQIVTSTYSGTRHIHMVLKNII